MYNVCGFLFFHLQEFVGIWNFCTKFWLDLIILIPNRNEAKVDIYYFII